MGRLVLCMPRSAVHATTAARPAIIQAAAAQGSVCRAVNLRLVFLKTAAARLALCGGTCTGPAHIKEYVLRVPL